jgi:anti-anti-sigma regulatory factor
VQHISSSVIGKMITLHRKLHRNEGALVICDMSPDVAEILYRSRLMDYFNTADDVNGALVALR